MAQFLNAHYRAADKELFFNSMKFEKATVLRAN